VISLYGAGGLFYNRFVVKSKNRFNPSTSCLTCLLFFLLLGVLATKGTASVLDIGTDYRFRGISLGSPNYGAPEDHNYDYYSQRALAHIGGRFSPNIEFMTQFQALGVVGSSASVTDPVGNQAGSRYPNTNFTPWVQWAYFKATDLHDLPVDITVGRQPIIWGDGLILSDDDLGFTGVRVQSRLPWYDLQGDIFTFKTNENLVSSSDSNIYGLQLTKPMNNIRIQISYLNQHDGSGTTIYQRPFEIAGSNGIPVNANFAASNIERSFYDARVEGRLLQGGFYKGEFALQSGHVDRDPSIPGGSVTLGGYAGLISAGLYTRFSKYGPIELHGLFGIASGDSGNGGNESSGGNAGTDNAFYPSFGHQFDGLERSGFGELFGASLYNAVASSANPNGLPPGDSGIRVIGGGVTTHPTALLSIGIDYFVYDAMEQHNAQVGSSATGSSLGSELDIGAGFAYTNYLTFRASAAFFSPGSAFVYASQAHRYLLEARGRF